MSKKHKHIFSSSECVSTEMLKAYLKEKLHDDQKREVEKHLVDCPMCRDELEGLELFPSIQAADMATDELNQRIDGKFGKAKRKVPIVTYVSSAAAAILILIVSGYLIVNNHPGIKV